MGLNEILLSIFLILCSILVVFCIVICIKLLYTADKMNIILTDVEKKLASTNGIFKVMDNVTSTLTNVTDFIVSKFLRFKKNRKGE